MYAYVALGFPEEALDLVVLDRADELIEPLRLLGRGGDRGHLMLLGEKDCQRKSDISDSCYCDLHDDIYLLNRIVI